MSRPDIRNQNVEFHRAGQAQQQLQYRSLNQMRVGQQVEVQRTPLLYGG